MTDIPLYTRYGDLYTGQHGKPRSFDAAKGSAHVCFVGKCGRCGGAGGADKWVHTGFKCYDCGGSGNARRETTLKLYTAEKLAKLNVTAEKARVKKQAKINAARAEARALARASRKANLAADLEVLKVYWPLRHAITIEAQGHWLDGVRPAAKKPVHEILRSILRRGEASEKQIAALGTFAANHVKRLQEGKRRAASAYVGTTGERLTLTLTCTKVIEFYGKDIYGQECVKRIHVLVDAEGNSFKTFGVCGIAEGETATVKATVKEHSIYKEERQTMLTRIKVLEEAK